MGLKKYFEMRAVATFYQIIFVVIVVSAVAVYNYFSGNTGIGSFNDQTEEGSRIVVDSTDKRNLIYKPN